MLEQKWFHLSPGTEEKWNVSKKTKTDLLSSSMIKMIMTSVTEKLDTNSAMLLKPLESFKSPFPRAFTGSRFSLGYFLHPTHINIISQNLPARKKYFRCCSCQTPNNIFRTFCFGKTRCNEDCGKTHISAHAMPGMPGYKCSWKCPLWVKLFSYHGYFFIFRSSGCIWGQ